MTVIKIASFADGSQGGNPAGVVISEQHPTESEMRCIAAEVGYSETAFAMPQGQGWRVRYFSPESEVPFCGHATIALGAALAMQNGNGVFPLQLNAAEISVEGKVESGQVCAALQSPATHSKAASEALVSEVLKLFGYSQTDLNEDIPSALAHGGADHLIIALNSRAALSAMDYQLQAGREIMQREGLVTIMFVFSETPTRFHSRNAFASGGVFEDPATGAASAAFAGYLRDLGWSHQGSIEIIQGEDMGMRSIIHAEIPDLPGSSIRVSGSTRMIEDV